LFKKNPGKEASGFFATLRMTGKRLRMTGKRLRLFTNVVARL